MQLANNNFQPSPQAKQQPKASPGAGLNQQPQLVAKKMIDHYSYVLSEQIGKGFSSKVFKGKNEKTGDIVAIKVIDMKLITNEVEQQLLQQEINALKLLNSQNIVKMLDHYQTTNNTYIVMEFCNQGDLSKVLKESGTIPEALAIKIMKHILNGFKEQVKKGIIHRDLKPTNVFLKNGIPKIADYGFSKMMNAPKEKVYYNVGTPLYMSPQTIIQNKYSEKSDIWSLGIIFYELLFGQVPWQAGSEKELANLMCSYPPVFPSHIPISEEAKNFILQCLTVDEDLRISSSEMEMHPLFQRRNTTTSIVKQKNVLKNNTFDAEQKTTSSIQQQGMRSLSNHQKDTRKIQSIERGHTTYAKLGKQANFVSSMGYQKPQIQKNEMEQESKAMQSIYKSNMQINDEIIQCQLNFVKFIFRIAKIIDHFNYFETPFLKEKLLFFTVKNILIKLTKLRDLIEKQTNPLGLLDFNNYLEQQQMNKFKQEISDNFAKFKNFFTILWNQINQKKELKEELLADRKFDAIFDQTFLEFESFYIFLCSLLRSGIHELQKFLKQRLEQIDEQVIREQMIDFNQDLTQEDEAGIVLLDFMTIYYQLAQLIIDNFDNIQAFTKSSKMQHIAESKPVKLKKVHFQQICQKINSLKI